MNSLKSELAITADKGLILRAREIGKAFGGVNDKTRECVTYIIKNGLDKKVALASLRDGGVEKAFASKIWKVSQDKKLSTRFLKGDVGINKSYQLACAKALPCIDVGPGKAEKDAGGDDEGSAPPPPKMTFTEGELLNHIAESISALCEQHGTELSLIAGAVNKAWKKAQNGLTKEMVQVVKIKDL